ncbi:MAG: hypothetical protein CVU47_06675 [Chloroflexi bacterium HGW-Chloroflexi-9]|nr:MAG: hypothetical protein CVU47_06675 [Chloroflexi bacterium HGW-Chloroflexi-9]
MIDFGLVDAVDAEAIGQPGQRTFRLRARSGDSYAALWIEKEQLAQLGRLFSQLLAERSKLRGQPTTPVETVGNFPQRAQVDMQVARLGMDYDGDAEQLILLADDQSAMERGDTPAFRMAMSRDQAVATIRLIEEIVTAGRPVCPMCKQPLNFEGEQHFCPHTNGHSKELEVPPVEDDEPEDE